MVQRLSVAQALVGSPETLILDEPMIGLDPAGVAHFREVFRELRVQGQRNRIHVLTHHERSRIIVHFSRNYSQRKNTLQRTSKRSRTKNIKLLAYPAGNQPFNIPNNSTIKKDPGNRHRSTPQTTATERKPTTIEIVVSKQDIDIRPLISDLVVKSGAKLYTIKQGENMLERAYIEALKETDGGKP